MQNRPSPDLKSVVEIVSFLNGTGPLDGKWFGDKDDSGKAFWWRKYLPLLLTQKDRLDKLEEALRPFARYADVASGMAGSASAEITRADWYKARQALTGSHT